MKRVAIIYKNSDNPKVMDYLRKSLENIFMNYVVFEDYYLKELDKNQIIYADAYILTGETMLYSLKKHISNYNNIVFMHRNLNRKSIDKVSKIPKDTNVLVVNDTYESSIKVLCSLYELGTNHINLIPFDPNDVNNPTYKECKTCITANEMALVPNYIENTINIGYREINFDTLIRLMNRLNLNFDLTNRNLIRHIKSISQPDISFYEDYLNNFIKSYVFKSVINDSKSALIITNEKHNLLFSNNKAKSLFSIDSKIPSLSLENIFCSANLEIIQKEATLKTSMIFNKVEYFVDKKPIMLLDEVIGYSITLESEKDLIEREININELLKKKGHYARYCFTDIIHHSPAMKECINIAKTVALTDNTVLITGESGTGKELIAQSIHNYSNRKNRPFIALNCAALPESLLESELFGYESGSFTGAKKDGKLGLFEQANGGTIFLDEIGDITYDFQAKLLRVLQEHQIIRIGSDKVRKIDTRIIAATNKDLMKEVEKGNFRKDLYYRLNVITILVESLRNRKQDILPLMAHFLGEKYSQLTSSDRSLLYNYEWPGNVRELQNVAIHFNTLSKLPNHILVSLDSCLGINRIAMDKIDIELEVLKIIRENTHPYSGIGRVKLNTQLKTMKIHISDSNLRNILQSLQEKNLVEIAQGRGGTRITELGINHIEKYEIQLENIPSRVHLF